MGVCCIVFDIYGILFEFFMNFLNIEKNKCFLKTILSHFISRFMLFSTLKNIEKCPFTYWLNGRCGNLYPIYPLFPCSDFLSQMGGGGGVFLAFYAISNISRKHNSGNKFFFFFFRKTILFHLIFSLCFFMLDLFPTFLDFFWEIL